MKTLILYYTFGGKSKQKAEELATNTEDATICEVKEKKKRMLLTAFIPGCPQAMGRKVTKLQPIDCKMEEYDQIKIVCPIWASHPAPAFNAIVEQLPAGKDVELYLCSGGGDSAGSAEGTKQLIKDKGCNLVGYHDVASTSES